VANLARAGDWRQDPRKQVLSQRDLTGHEGAQRHLRGSFIGKAVQCAFSIHPEKPRVGARSLRICSSFLALRWVQGELHQDVARFGNVGCCRPSSQGKDGLRTFTRVATAKSPGDTREQSLYNTAHDCRGEVWGGEQMRHWHLFTMQALLDHEGGEAVQKNPLFLSTPSERAPPGTAPHPTPGGSCDLPREGRWQLDWPSNIIQTVKSLERRDPCHPSSPRNSGEPFQGPGLLREGEKGNALDSLIDQLRHVDRLPSGG
jgi:hypothetical protein